MKRITALLLVSAVLLCLVPSFSVMANETSAYKITDLAYKYAYDSSTGEYTVYDESVMNIITPGWTEPVFKTEAEGGITDSSATGYYSALNLSSYTKLFSDTNYRGYNYLLSAPVDLKNTTYIQLTKAWAGTRDPQTVPNSNTECEDVLSFKINHSAEIYYIYPDNDGANNYAPWLAENGWKVPASPDVVLAESVGNITNDTTGILKNFILCSKKIKVEEGQTASVNVGGYNSGNGNYFPPMVFVRWIESSADFGEISNPKFKVYDSTTTTASYVDVDEGNIVSTGISAPFNVVSDNESYFTNIPDYLADADYIRLKRAWREPRKDSNNPNAQNAQSEVLTFEINQTANVYYAPILTSYSQTSTYSQWLLDEKWSRCNEKLGFMEIDNPEKELVVYKKKFVVEEGEKVTVKIGGYYQNYWVPFIFVDWVDEDTTKNVNIIVNGDATCYFPGNQDAAINEPFAGINVVPASGKVVEYVKYNETVIPVGKTAGYAHPIANVTEDAVIEYVISDAPTEPEITVYNTPFVSTEDELNAAYVFARATDYITGYERTGFGLLFTDTETEDAGFIKGASGIIDIAGVTPPNAMGQYGVKIVGTKLVAGKYYTKPYAVYKNSETGEEVVKYGEIIPFTISE